MDLAFMVLDANRVVTSLKISGIITAGCALLFVIIIPLRLHRVWKRTRLVRISMPCEDPQSVRFLLAEALKQFGYQASPEVPGGFTLEPSSWRRKFGATAVMVDFPEPRQAVITGQAVYLADFARRVRVPLALMPNNPAFSKWMMGRSKPFVLIVAGLFVAMFLTILFAMPTRSQKKVVDFTKEETNIKPNFRAQ